MRKSLRSLSIMGMLAAHSQSYGEPMQWPTFGFTGKYPKKQNKLSQKAKRKRARRMGKHG